MVFMFPWLANINKERNLLTFHAIIKRLESTSESV